MKSLTLLADSTVIPPAIDASVAAINAIELQTSRHKPQTADIMLSTSCSIKR